MTQAFDGYGDEDYNSVLTVRRSHSANQSVWNEFIKVQEVGDRIVVDRPKRLDDCSNLWRTSALFQTKLNVPAGWEIN